MNTLRPRQSGFGVMDALIAVAIMSIIVLTLARISYNRSQASKSAKQNQIFQGKMGEVTDTIGSRESCDCVLKEAFNQSGASVLNQMDRESTPAGLSLDIQRVFAMQTIQLVTGGNPVQVACCPSDPADATKTNCPDNQIDLAKVGSDAAASMSAPAPQSSSSAMVTVSKIQLRNIRYGGRILKPDQTDDNLEIYLADFAVEGSRQGGVQSGLASALNTSFVVEVVDDTTTPKVRRFHSCYNRQAYDDFENWCEANPTNPSCTP